MATAYLHTNDKHDTQTTLTLQSLIDTRHSFHNHRSGTNTGGSDFFGQRLSNRRGQGVEFTDLRQYTSGDDIRHIDWNVTARSNEPHTRLYREEREHTTTAVVDFRSSMFSGSHCLRSVCAGKLAASVLWRASDTGSRCSAVVVTNRGQRSSRPLGGKTGVLQACELIASEFSKVRYSPDQADVPLSGLLKRINQPNRQVDSWYVFSAFDSGNDKQWQKQLSVSGFTGRMIAVMLLDPLEISGLPTGIYPYQDASISGNATINKTNQAEVKNALQHNINQTLKEFDRNGIPVVVHNTSSPRESVLATLHQRSLL